MGAKISLSAGNTWDRVNRVIISQPRHDVDQALRAEADKVSLLFEDDVHFTATCCCLTPWSYQLHPEDKARSHELGLGMQTVVGSREGTVKFFRAKDPAHDGHHHKEGVDPYISRHSTSFQHRATKRRHDSHTGAVTCVAACQEGRVAVTSSADSTLIIWHVSDAAHTATLKGHSGGVTCCDMSRDGSLCVSGGEDHRVMIWDVATATRSHVLGGRRRDMESILKTLSLKEKRKWLSLPRALLHEMPITAVCLPKLGPMSKVASGSRDTTAIIWDVEACKGVVQFKGHEDFVSSVAFSPLSGGSDILISGSYDRTIRVWDTRTGGQVGCLTGHMAGVTCLDITHSLDNGQLIFSGAWDGTVKVWDMFKMEERRTLLGHYDSVNSLQVVGNGQHMMTVSQDAHVRVWNTRTFQQVPVKILQTLGPNKVPITIKVNFDVDDSIACNKELFVVSSTAKDEHGEFVIKDRIFHAIPPPRQNWVIFQNGRSRRVGDDETIREMGLHEDEGYRIPVPFAELYPAPGECTLKFLGPKDYVEIIKPLTDEEYEIAKRRQAANDARKAKEAKREERRKRSSAMGFGVINKKEEAASASNVTGKAQP